MEKKPPARQANRIETTLGALADASQALGRLAQRSLPIRVAYDVKKLIQLATPELQNFHEQREKLIVEFGAERTATKAEVDAGVRQPGEKVFAVKPARMDAFVKRERALREIAVALHWRRVKVSALGERAEIAAADLLVLEPLLEDDRSTKDGG